MIIKWPLIGLLLYGSLSATNAQTNHFRFTSNTGENATVGVPLTSNPNINGSPLATGDEIGVFSPAGLCVGAVVWDGTGAAITVWGDNSQTPDTVDGMRSGEEIHYRVWQQSSNKEYAVVSVSYSQGNGVYAANGLYVLDSFNATAPPDPPSLASPDDGAANIPVSPTLAWTSTEYADSYHIQISPDQGFATLQVDESNLTDTSYTASGLGGNATYYWRVRGSNAAGPGDFSASRSFTTTDAPPSAPILADPPDGAIDQPATLTLSWNASSEADSYRVQVSQDSLFNTFAEDSSLPGTSLEVGPLEDSTSYFWRVNASNAGGSSEWSAVWKFTTIPAPPPAPILIGPSDGSVDQSTTLTLEWNTSSGADSYHVQVSSDSLFGSIVVDDTTLTTTSREVGPLDNDSRYFWRVRAKNSGGTSPFSTVWSFTTIAVPPDSPSLASPTDGVINQPRTLELQWHSSSGAAWYHLQLSTSPSLSTIAFEDTSIVDTVKEVGPLLDNATHYWRVRAGNSAGWSSFSAAWNFTTRSDDAPVAITDSATNITATSAQMNGRVVPNVDLTEVKFNYGTSPSFGNSVNALESPVSGTDTVEVTNILRGLQPNTTYHFAVSAFNSAGTATGENMSFTTAYAVAAPMLIAPADSSVDLQTTVTFQWHRSPEATAYTLQISTSESFTSMTFEDTTLTDTTRTVSSLTRSTLYYWRVQARNSIGTSPWSDVWQFTTVPPPPEAPLPYSPSISAIDQPMNVTLIWRASAGAETYQVQLATSSNFSTLTLDRAGLTDSSTVASGLSNNTTYYWRVRATNEGGTSEWSTVWYFTVSFPAPAAPTLVSPASGSTDQSVPVTLVWNESANTSTYQLQVSTQSTFGNLIVNDTTITATSRQVTLAYGKTYYWRVRARNSAGTSGWSSVWNFTTAGSSVSHSIMLPKGWNMISSFVQPANPALDSLCRNIRSVMQIMKNGDGEAYVPAFEINQIGDWKSEDGYQIYMDIMDTLVVDGSELLPEIVPISMLQGWSMVSYLRNDTLAIETALQSITANLKIAKNNDGEAYVPAFQINTIGPMQPGEGYQMYLSQSDTLVYPSNGSSSQPAAVTAMAKRASGGERTFTALSDTTMHFRFKSRTGNNASVIVPTSSNPHIAGTPLSNGDEIGAFTPDGMCVGAIVWTGANDLITVWGDDDQTSEIDGIRNGENISYKIWQKSTGTEFDSVTVSYSDGDGSYVPNGYFVLDTLRADPVTFVETTEIVPREFYLHQNYPNPFNPSTVIEYGVPYETHVQLGVYNIIGQRIAVPLDERKPAGNHKIFFSISGVPNGVYFYRLIADEVVMTRRMVILR